MNNTKSYASFKPNFSKAPYIEVKGKEDICFTGWEAICSEVERAAINIDKPTRVIVVEPNQGVHHNEILVALQNNLKPGIILLSSEAFLPEKEIRRITWPDVTDDRVFGYMTRLNMSDFLDEARISQLQQQIAGASSEIIIVYGYGASMIVPEADVFIYADMARWEIQQRMRRNEIDNLGISNKNEHFELQYKRGFFVDWRVCDRLKKQTVDKWDYVLDTNIADHPKMITGKAFQAGLAEAVSRPFSLAPYFDPGPWGGRWMMEVFDLESPKDNLAWCFNCVPEENSMYLKFGEVLFESPSINLVFFQTIALLGDAVHARFGDEFPIRFDFLDTMGGGNLSLQVHPLTEYIQQKFGMNYTQDESYYLVDADEDASVFLGLREGIDPEEMINDLRHSEATGTEFHASKFIQNWPAKKHDHFLIPGGTVHCSGKNSMVLEISSTPYIFTFKLWDWGRKGLDGKPRPINIEHGINVIQWNRTTEWTREQLIDKVEKIAGGDGWTEEKTGLHKREFIETRRHWFTKKVSHHTNGGINVLNLVEGREAVVESPSNAFEPFVVHYAETFLLPAAVGEYTLRPHGESEGKQCATIKAFIRTNA